LATGRRLCYADGVGKMIRKWVVVDSSRFISIDILVPLWLTMTTRF
jgi:hypothetical protein